MDLISVSSSGTQGGWNSNSPSISSDGRYVAFVSRSKLALADGYMDSTDDQIFLRDNQLGTTKLISVSSSGVEGFGGSAAPSISADGHYIVFSSWAGNLVAGDSNGAFDIFLHDNQTGSTTPLSKSSSGVLGNSNSYSPDISADGRYVVFSSSASNLVAGDNNGTFDIFLHDNQTGSTTLLSKSASGVPGNGSSQSPDISADGRYVVFSSNSSNLVVSDGNGQQDIFLCDTTTGIVNLVSATSAGVQGNGLSESPSISANGRYIAFVSQSSNFMAVDSNSGASDVFLRDTQSGVTTLISVSSDGVQGNSFSETPSISANGRYIAFMSQSSNFVSNDYGVDRDIFLRDTQTATTTLLSISSSGFHESGADSGSPSISADGLYVAFDSWQGIFLATDRNRNQAQDVFRTGTNIGSTGNHSPTGSVSISGTAKQGQTLTANHTLVDADGLGTINYQWLENGIAINGATARTLVLEQAQVGKTITVKASYTDGGGSVESKLSIATSMVLNVNDAPIGSVVVNGTAKQGETLTASNTLTDADGLGTISYQWFANGVAISGATADSLVLGQAQVGKAITVKASYTDGGGTKESKTSAATSAALNINDAPTGTVTISGIANQGQTLTARHDLVDADGLGAVGYQWLADGIAIVGAVGSTLKLELPQVGKTIGVVVRYTDGGGTVESKASSFTSAVLNVNNLPTGTVNISGTTKQGQTLTASHTLVDMNGLGTISYQWLADGVVISGATTSALKLTQEQVGKKITVKASYTDGGGNVESKTSAATSTVLNVNDAPTGAVTISGTPSKGQTLTASHTLVDADGLGVVSYQWLANGVAIGGATANTLVLGPAQVGKTITVKASYTDGGGGVESKTSAASSAVLNVNDVPTGSVVISGTAKQGETLTASHTLADVDGLGTINYQWLANGVAISGATADSLVLGQAQVGKAITVKASYTDGGGTAESKTSAATSAALNINDAPTGTVTISGTTNQGQTLTARHDLVDADGLGTISYQWLADGVVISSTTTSALKLTQEQVGKKITVKASYTDGGGNVESKTSAATSTVLNVNDAPTGAVTISGTPSKGQTLTASHTLVDADGLGVVSYQWLANGVAIGGATANTLVLGPAQVGKTITVKASYTDGGGGVESKTSAASSAVLNVNDVPTGSVVISGTAKQGETLTASHTLADVDGLGTINYQWLANGVAISGATADSLVLGQAQVGKAITVKASYTDGGGTAESKTSAATSVVLNVNDAPTGTVTISGIANQGQTLTARHDLVDADGLGTISYQWLADGVVISGATTSALKLTQEQVGKTITVKASYTDGGGNVENKTSAATGVVGNVDGVLPGNVSISSSDVITAEDGKSAVFSVQLDKAPINPVTIQFAVSDSTEATLPTTSLTFTSANWNTAQSLTVVGRDDDLEDGDITYQLKATVLTDDLLYKRVTIAPIELTNENDRVDAPLYLYGDSGSNQLQGKYGADYLYGRGGSDTLGGDRGNDWLYGGSGDDELDGGEGADNIYGGDGSDIYYVDNARDLVIETNANTITGGIDTVISTSSNYTLPANVENGRISTNSVANLTGNTLDNVLYAAAGDNVLNGVSGTDTVSYLYGLVSGGTTGVNVSLAIGTAQITGGSGKDALLNIQNITGSSLDDRLTGDNRNNVLDGGAGNDTLIGGLGKDSLLGGVGNDVFDFNAINDMGISNTTWDVIVDFVSGQDKIDLSTLDANALTTSNDAFSGTLIAATDSFTVAGQLKLVVSSGNGVLYGNTDTDADAEFAIQLTGVTTLSATDFVL